MQFSCIIPAYNEWPRIAKVLRTVLDAQHIDEVLVINDGSTDDTKKMIDAVDYPKLTKIHLEKNGGKAQAIMHGIQKAQWEYIVFIDADLLGLTPKHIDALILPVINHESDVTLSIRENSLGLYRWMGSDFVSGERVVPKSLFHDTQYYTEGYGFGLEVKMNEKILEQWLRIKNIFLPGVITPRKSDKMGYIKGIIADMKMVRDILATIPFWRIFRQMYRFSRFCSASSESRSQ